MNEPCHTCERAMAHIWRSHGTHMKESWHICMRHVTHLTESCHRYERAMSYIWLSRVTHMNEPCRTYEQAMSHIWTRHGTHMKESWWHTFEYRHRWTVGDSCASRHTFDWAMSQMWMSHVTHMNETWHKFEYRHRWTVGDSCSHLAPGQRAPQQRRKLSPLKKPSPLRKLWPLPRNRDMTYSWVWHGAFNCFTWHIQQRYDPSLRIETRRIHLCHSTTNLRSF